VKSRLYTTLHLGPLGCKPLSGLYSADAGQKAPVRLLALADRRNGTASVKKHRNAIFVADQIFMSATLNKGNHVPTEDNDRYVVRRILCCTCPISDRLLPLAARVCIHGCDWPVSVLQKTTKARWRPCATRTGTYRPTCS